MAPALRRGELMALRANRIDLDANVVRVERGWDANAGEVATKNGKPRTVPVAAPLRELLLRHLMRTGRRDTDLVFGATATEPFAARQLTTRADAAWTEAKLRRITLHECRHTFGQLPDRGRGERQGRERLHGQRQRGVPARPLRPPVPGRRERSGRRAGHLP